MSHSQGSHARTRSCSGRSAPGRRSSDIGSRRRSTGYSRTERDGRHSRPGSRDVRALGGVRGRRWRLRHLGRGVPPEHRPDRPRRVVARRIRSSRDGRPRRSQRLLSGRRRPRRPRGDRRDRSRPELGVLLRGRARHALFRDRRGDGRANDPVTGRGCRPLDEFLALGFVFENRTTLEGLSRVPFDGYLTATATETLQRFVYEPASSTT